MPENIGWVFKVVHDTWTELHVNSEDYKNYIDNIKNSDDGEVSEIISVDKINLKKNYYLTKTNSDKSLIIYIDKPVEYTINPHDGGDVTDADKYYNLWKENLIKRLTENSSQQGGGPNAFGRWINANKQLYLYDLKKGDQKIVKYTHTHTYINT